MRLILLGSPGSGKGTQAKLLSDRLGLTDVGTGDILREAMRQGTPAGRQAAPYVNKGQLVPDDLVNALINERFDRPDRPEHFVMDGYPRTLAQAKSFDIVLKRNGLNLGAVVFVKVDDEQIVQRLSGRWSCPKCKSTYHKVLKPPAKPGVCDLDGEPLIQRPDDQEATVRERLRYYHQNTVDLIPYYHQQGILQEVSGEGLVEQVYSRILKVLNPKASSKC
ncbi:MAG TPA: adenylate kinase [Gemmataceae bacterium]|jgi:adenylate kinase|nr:adenylate kinase [Gemmataceae bacterium]